MQDPTPTPTRPPARASSSSPARAPTVAVGDAVLVDAHGQTSTTRAGRATARTSQPVDHRDRRRRPSHVVSHGNALPAPVVLGPDDGAGHLRARPRRRQHRADADHADPLGPGLLRVRRGHAGRGRRRPGRRPVELLRRAVRHDQARPAPPPTAAARELLGENQTPAGRLEVVAARRLRSPALDVGDVLQGATVGPLDYSQFGGYVLEASTLGTRRSTTTCRAVTATAGHGEAAVGRDVQRREPRAQGPGQRSTTRWPRASSPTSPRPTSWRWRRSRTTAAPTDDGIVAADQTLTKLTAADRRRRRPALPVARDRPGQRPGRRPARRQHPRRVPVQPGPGRRSSTPARVERQPLDHRHAGRRRSTAQPALTLSPGRIDPTNPVWNSSRKPLVGQFRFKRQERVRHRQPLRLQGRRPERRRPLPVPGPVVGAAARRPGAGRARLRRDSCSAADDRREVVVVGDLNDYQFSPALAVAARPARPTAPARRS